MSLYTTRRRRRSCYLLDKLYQAAVADDAAQAMTAPADGLKRDARRLAQVRRVGDRHRAVRIAVHEEGKSRDGAQVEPPGRR